VSFAVPFSIDGHVSTMNAVESAAVSAARSSARLCRAARNGRFLAAWSAAVAAPAPRSVSR
jgi:hypothetical protein